MPSYQGWRVDIFNSAPNNALPIGVVHTPEPDPSFTAILEVDTAVRSWIDEPTITYEQRFRWVEEFLRDRSAYNLVSNPMLQYTNPTGIPVNAMPPGWVLVSSSQSDPNRWRFYPMVVDPGNTIGGDSVFPRSIILNDQPDVGSPFTLFFPNGYVFLYNSTLSASMPVSCVIRGTAHSVQVNVPYVLEVYYTTDPLPPFASGYSYPSDSSWRTQSRMRASVFGKDVGGSVVETALLQATSAHRGQGSDIGRSNYLARYPLDLPNYLLAPPGVPRLVRVDRVRRWVCSSNIVFHHSGTVSADIELEFTNLPGLAVIAVVMYPRSEMMAFRWEYRSAHFRNGVEWAMRSYPSYSFGSNPRMVSTHPSGTGSLAADYRGAHAMGNLPVPYAGKDTRSVNRPMPPLQYNLFSALGDAGLVFRYGIVFATPPSNGDPPSYLQADVDSLPANGADLISYPYSGTYQSAPREILNGVVTRTWSVPSTRQMANFVELLSDDIPVELNRKYRFYTGSFLVDTGPDYPPVNPSRCPYYVRSESDTYRYVAIGYDHHGDVTEIVHFSTQTAPALGCSNTWIRFTNPNTTKARLGIVFMQPYVHPADLGLPGNQPYLVLSPMKAAHIFPLLLADFWPGGVDPSPSDANLIPNDVADFHTGWMDMQVLEFNPTGQESGSQTGYVRISPWGWLSQTQSWLQSAPMFLHICIRVRFRLANTYPPQDKDAVPILVLRMQWLSDAGVSLFIEQNVDLRDYNDTQWHDLLLVAPVFAVLKTEPYPNKIEVRVVYSGSRAPVLYLGYLNIGFVNDPAGLNIVRRRVSVGHGPIASAVTIRKPPRVIGVAEVSRFHWGVKVRPGLAYVPYTVTPDEVSHSFVRRAGFSPGDQLVLVYTLPEFARTQSASRNQRGLYVPYHYRTEPVNIRNGVFRVTERVLPWMDMTLYLPDGTSVSGRADGVGGVFRAGEYGREVTLLAPSLSGYSGSAVVRYAHYGYYYTYTGCFYEDSGSPQPAVFNLSPYGTDSAKLSGPFIAQLMHEDPFHIYSASPVNSLIGAYLYLMPSRAILRSDFEAGDRTGVALPFPGYTGSYLRHALGHFPLQYGLDRLRRAVLNSSGNVVAIYEMAALVLAWCTYMTPLGTAYIDLLDIRFRGGGLPDGHQPPSPGAYWDMSDWDGDSVVGGGRAIVRLPRSLLEPAPDRDAFTHEEILEIVHRYLPVGIDYEVEYVD